MEGAPYPRYHSIETSTGWSYPNKSGGPPLMTVYITRTQSDPYARPTRVKIVVPGDTAMYDRPCVGTARRRTALGGLIARRMHSVCRSIGGDRSAQAQPTGGGGGGEGGTDRRGGAGGA